MGSDSDAAGAGERHTSPGSEEERIHILSPELADQIAAGEVVERPASAVKELVENAIDAGATRINVEIEEGGLKRIRVTDDGCGMGAADARIAVRRHATSKISNREDLFAIGTLGFRGEALPSIASVSRFELITKPAGRLGGTRVVIEGGERVSEGEYASAPGTSITVDDLFFNTPARLKFMKTRSTEVKHVLEAVQRLALPRPDVAFSVVHNGRRVLDLPVCDGHYARVHSIVGRDDSAYLYAAPDAEQDGVRVSGFFSQPALTRRTTNGIYTFVNGRFVRDSTILGAIRVAYRGLIDRGRHPVVILFLEVATAQVDVNVHPMKTEVRFHRADAAFRAVRRALANGLSACPWLPRGDADAADDGGATASRAGDPGPISDWSAAPTGRPSDATQAPRRYAADRFSGVPVGDSMLDGLPSRSYALRAGGPAAAGEGGLNEVHTEDLLPETGYFSSLVYAGQVHSLYLVCSDPEGLVVVDQHAAHERITFERLRTVWAERRTQQQPMLLPEVLHFDSLRAAILSDNLDFFAALGFDIEPFGDTDFALKAVPAMLSGGRYANMLTDALDDLADTGDSGRVDEAIDAILSRMACHGSVRSGDTLSPSEARALLEELDAVDFGANCPHGRPVYFRMSLAEMERRFDRR